MLRSFFHKVSASLRRRFFLAQRGTFFADCRGSTAVILGIAALPFGIMIGASVDYGRLTTAKSNLQNAVDAAVLAGAAASSGTQTTVAQHTLTGALGAQSSLVTAQNFVVNGDGTLTGSASLTLPMTFMQLAQISTHAVSASATASTMSTTIQTTSSMTSNVCILIKDPTSSQTLLINSGVTISAPQCEIDVASTGGPAAMINNGAGVNVASLCIAGGSVTTNGAAPANMHKSCTTATDPFYGQLPAVGSTACTVSNQNYSGNTNLSPGVYCGNFNFNGQGTLNLAAGLYVFKGTRWNLNSGWNVTGTGVTIYYADASSYIQVNSGVAINISAPTSGTYANILMYEPTGLPTSSFSINGSAGHSFTGLIYLPSRNVTFNSVSTVASESITMVFNQLILDTINWKFASGAKTIAGSAQTTTTSSTSIAGVRLLN